MLSVPPCCYAFLTVAAVACASRHADPVAQLAATQLPELADDPGVVCRNNPSQDSTVYDTTQVSPKPRVVSGPRLTYPYSLRRLRITGSVVLSLIINADGSLDHRSVRVLKSDHLKFEDEVLAYVRYAVFLPGCRRGQGVRTRMALPVEFRSGR